MGGRKTSGCMRRTTITGSLPAYAKRHAIGWRQDRATCTGNRRAGYEDKMKKMFCRGDYIVGERGEADRFMLA